MQIFYNVRNEDMNRILHLFIMLGIVLILVGCDAPEPTPTPSPSPEPVVEAGEVIFDEGDCKVTVPNNIPTGWYSFSFKNLAEDEYDLVVAMMEEGKTFQDLLDAQNEPGEPVRRDNLYTWARQPTSAQLKSDGSKVHTFHFSIEGEYFIYAWSWETETRPHRMWLCSPFWVTGDSSN